MDAGPLRELQDRAERKGSVVGEAALALRHRRRERGRVRAPDEGMRYPEFIQSASHRPEQRGIVSLERELCQREGPSDGLHSLGEIQNEFAEQRERDQEAAPLYPTIQVECLNMY